LLSAVELSKIALYINLDMIASPNPGYFIYDGDGSAFNMTGPAGSAEIEKKFEDHFKEIGVVSAQTEFDGRSDHEPFLKADVPSGGLFTGAEGIMTEQQAQWWGGKAGVAYDACYHKECDGLANLNSWAWTINTKAAAHVIATYARSLEGFPRHKQQRSRLKASKMTHSTLLLE
jgi:Zn-dependent M28 family amino/carboxypeptidase